ncbi:hypothetical protein EIP91_009232 [Steccherinum ochraceum]|uniref:Fatty acid desaturase domain-containing protein n=1 Tax=Steccherinum ochraceum TaxID=92696 RepID=A0A4R0RK13_9APHY|nr:hypothetical protein EIP91_009232 [Steccherinum ochraceum]
MEVHPQNTSRKKTNNLHHEETHLPWLRSDFKKLPPEDEATAMDYKEMVEETPAFTLFRMFIRQFIGFQMYLAFNRKGNPKYPPWTSHYNPNAKIYKPEHHDKVVFTDMCILTMLALLTGWGFYVGSSLAWNLYWVPWFWVHNWIVTFTYLQHSDPTVPYYRQGQWTFLRGALCTVDRPLLGWIGEFFWFNVSKDHLAHHIFAYIPFYHLPEVTEAIKPILGEYYLYDSTPVFYALWRSFSQCQFVENEGDIVFFRDQKGQSKMQLKMNDAVEENSKQEVANGSGHAVKSNGHANELHVNGNGASVRMNGNRHADSKEL